MQFLTDEELNEKLSGVEVTDMELTTPVPELIEMRVKTVNQDDVGEFSFYPKMPSQIALVVMKHDEFWAVRGAKTASQRQPTGASNMTDFRFKFPVRRYVRNFDGDSITLEIDRGFNEFKQVTVRLYQVDTPEINRGTELTKTLARYVRDLVQKFVSEGKEIYFTSMDWTESRGEIFGRLEVDGIDLGSYLIVNDLAIFYDGPMTAEDRNRLHTVNAEKAVEAGLIYPPPQDD